MKWKKWARIVGGIAILALVLSRTDFRDLTVRWTPTLIAGAAAVILCLFAAQGLSAYRWKVILGPDAPPWPFLFRLYLIAAFFSLFLPTAVGGDAVRAVAATPAGSGTRRAVGSVLLDRLLGVLALVIYLLIGLVVAPPAGLGFGAGGLLGSRTRQLALGIGLVGLVVGWLLLRRFAPVAKAIDQIRDLVVALAREPRRFAFAVGVGLAVQACYILAWLVLGISLALPIPPGSHLITVPIVSLSTMIPITLSGVGLREGAWTLLLARFGISAADAVAYSLLYFACWMVVAGSGGLVFSLKGTERSNSLALSEPAPRPGQAS
jgi:uncharacterized membrane protein YbhN (UPF0104 family)